jgi:hypothetical protein
MCIAIFNHRLRGLSIRRGKNCRRCGPMETDKRIPGEGARTELLSGLVVSGFGVVRD